MTTIDREALALEAVLVPAMLDNGIPHPGHNQACHEADAKLVRGAIIAAAPAVSSGLDVERLARALRAGPMIAAAIRRLGKPNDVAWERDADAIARAYDRETT